jgi:hypothetical protein
MKDQLNNVLKVGDIVIHVSSHGYLTFAVVAGFTEKMVKLSYHGALSKYCTVAPDMLIRTDLSHLGNLGTHHVTSLKAAIKWVEENGDQSNSAKPAKKSNLEI